MMIDFEYDDGELLLGCRWIDLLSSANIHNPEIEICLRTALCWLERHALCLGFIHGWFLLYGLLGD
jgi:hypothetical protein